MSFLFHQQPGASGGYFGAFILAFLLGAFTYAAWELPADMAEETKDAPTIAAKTMLISLVAVGIGGMILLVGYSYAAPSVSAIANSSTPILDVINYQWGHTAKDIVDVFFLISFVAVCLVIMAGAARLVYSLARDNMAPGSKLFAKVSASLQDPALRVDRGHGVLVRDVRYPREDLFDRAVIRRRDRVGRLQPRVHARLGHVRVQGPQGDVPAELRTASGSVSGPSRWGGPR